MNFYAVRPYFNTTDVTAQKQMKDSPSHYCDLTSVKIKRSNLLQLELVPLDTQLPPEARS
jgi:hypothetical protein